MLVTRLAANAPAAPEMRSALRLGIRSRPRDAATLSRPMKAAELDTMAKAVGDGAFRADLMSLLSLPHLAPRLWAAGTESIVHSIDAADRGTSNVIDAVILEDGLVVAALGEQGTVLLHRDGRTVARLPEPAYRFVLSDLRDRALALAPRDESWRVTRIDFVRRHATYWRDFRLDDFADTYDGATWFAAVDGALYAIDTAEEQLTSIWYNPDVGPVTDLVRTPSSVVLLTAGELWQYEIPSYLLRTRERVVRHEDEEAFRAALPSGGFVEVRTVEEGAGTRVYLRTGRSKAERVIGIFEGEFAGLATHPSWIAVVVRRDRDSQVVLLDPVTGRMRVQLHFGASTPRVRIQDQFLLAFDHGGRIVAVDLEQGVILRDLRI